MHYEVNTSTNTPFTVLRREQAPVCGRNFVLVSRESRRTLVVELAMASQRFLSTTWRGMMSKSLCPVSLCRHPYISAPCYRCAACLSTAPPKRHVLNCLVQNEPGVLSRVSGILAARGFNIDSLVVCSTEVEDLSRMTIVLTGQDGVVEQARRQLEDLVPVWAVLDYTNAALVQRELLLAKINILGPEYFEELLAHHREITTGDAALTEGNDPRDKTLEEVAHDFHPSRLVASEALRHKHTHLQNITYFAHQFGGKVLDISTNSCIVEISAKPSRIDSFLKLVAPLGILESARTGLMALPRSPLYGPNEDSRVKDADEVVDASQLPPG
ncbi:hypothetical protein P8C59_005312 [Phyllachora maydis]|uniref:ACT domain-containing protein n=1 Tax=Phyllachora maydis TaxID=1825666 RepID=A0AAD9MC51_9PEZI|nr:hypothetical protein P8C59_005312 [Phyllachora maydis]